MNDKYKTHDTLPVITDSTTEKTAAFIKVSGAQQAQINSDFIITLSTQEEVFKEKLRPMIG